MPDGYEALVLKPLANYPHSAQLIARDAATSDQYQHRKVAAALVGWIAECKEELLKELLDQERARDRTLAKDDFGRLDSQSVVEDVVFSATRWMRRSAQRDAAIDVLEAIVQRTIEGEYWNTASYAITTLCRYRSPGFDTLLSSFAAFSQGRPPVHPTRPSLAQERNFAEKLQARDPSTLESMERLLAQQDEAATADLDAPSQGSMDRLMDAARTADAEEAS